MADTYDGFQLIKHVAHKRNSPITIKKNVDSKISIKTTTFQSSHISQTQSFTKLNSIPITSTSIYSLLTALAPLGD